MNKFLAQLDITFRRDPTNYRPRINKVGHSPARTHTHSAPTNMTHCIFYIFLNCMLFGHLICSMLPCSTASRSVTARTSTSTPPIKPIR